MSGLSSGADLPFEVSVHVSEPGWAEVVEDAHRFAHRTAAALVPLLEPVPSGELSVALVSDVEIAELNKRFRDKEGPTNVLSFPATSVHSQSGQMQDHAPEMAQGDVVVALQTVLRECFRTGRTPRDHLAHLLVHGILHLHGHDHMNESEAGVMETLERRALASLGIADPY